MFPYSPIPWFYSGCSTRASLRCFWLLFHACPCEGGPRNPEVDSTCPSYSAVTFSACSREEYRKLWLTGMTSEIFRIAAHASFASGYMIMRQSTEFMPVSCPGCRRQFGGILRGFRHEEPVPVDARDAEPGSCPGCRWQFGGIFRGMCHEQQVPGDERRCQGVLRDCDRCIAGIRKPKHLDASCSGARWSISLLCGSRRFLRCRWWRRSSSSHSCGSLRISLCSRRLSRSPRPP